MNGCEERAAKRVKVDEDHSVAGASTSTAAATTSLKPEPATSTSTITNGASTSTSAVKKEQDKEYDDDYGLYEDYAFTAEAVPPSGDLYLDTVSSQLIRHTRSQSDTADEHVYTSPIS